MIRNDSDVSMLMWVAIATVVFKAVQGMWNYAVTCMAT